ncbi:MAG TPA: phage baseplate assembly protein V [Sphingobium sp.]|uniref:phage baseplate assembly protein V n=1 Tax=Sphingobium sp. TaxID=1912891 RepID=UPI002ED3F96C
MIDRILALIGIGRVKLTDDSGPVQLVQVDEGKSDPTGGRRLIDRVMKVGHFGFTSVPPLESEVVMVRPGGDRASSIAVGSNHQTSRPRNLKPGDSAVYDIRGQIIRLTDGGTEIDCAGLPCRIVNAASVSIDSSGPVTVNAPSVECSGPLKVHGTVTATAFVQAP